MPSENAEWARRAFELWNAGELDEYLERLADDVELRTDPSFPEGGTYRGHDEVRRFQEGLREGWERGGSVVPGEVRDAGDRVLADFEWQATGDVSGIETSSEWTVLYTFREDGQVARIQFFADRDEALASAGLD